MSNLVLPRLSLEHTKATKHDKGDTLPIANFPKCQEYEDALQRRDFRQVLWMVMNGDVPVNYESKRGETALLAAVSAKNVDAIMTLIKSGVSINTANQKGYTPLMKAIAVATQCLPKRKLCLATVASNNGKANQEAKVFDNDMVENVLAYEPNLLQMDHSRRTAFDWAKLTGNTQVLEWLTKHQQKRAMRYQSLAHSQARAAQCMALLQRHEGYCQHIELLIAPQFFDEDKLLKFLKTTTVSLKEFSSALKDLQVPQAAAFRSTFFVNIETNDGWTPLTKCAAFGYVAAIQALVTMGADYHYETRLRHTAMTWASYCGHEAVVLYFLRLKVDLNQTTRDGRTALLHAISNSQVKVVHHLLLATRDQCFPVEPMDTFSRGTQLKTLYGPTSQATSSNHQLSNAKPLGIEWHRRFLKRLQWTDQQGQDALMLALHVVEQSQLSSEELSPAVQVLRQLQTAIHRAEEHKQYVETHAKRTKLTTCHNDGCEFTAPQDVLPTHERYHCTKRSIRCANCDVSMTFEEQSRHDAHSCPLRRVVCINFEFGCHEQLPFQDQEDHLQYHCRKRALQCRLLCGSTVRYDKLDDHESNRCALRVVTCAQGCEATFTANVAKTHRRHQCPKRIVSCTGTNAMKGGCGATMRAEEMDFHLTSLCQLRDFACKWAAHGCKEKIGGAAVARYHHETKDCPFRLVLCRNECELSGQFLALFAEHHYAWQCTLEPKPCPKKCQRGPADAAEVRQLPEHLMLVHCLQDAGDCSLRETFCPLDLCGKRIRLLDRDQKCLDVLSSGDARMALVETRAMSLKAMQQRVGKYETFIARVEEMANQEQHDNCTSESRAKDTHVEGFESAAAVDFLLKWLHQLLTTLRGDCKELETRKCATAPLCRVLSYDIRVRKHLIEFPDGSNVWMALDLREYDVIPPKDYDMLKPSQDFFQCGPLAAQALEVHIEEECCHRLISCPLECGQRFPAHCVQMHCLNGCNKRNEICRLGCGQVMAFMLLGKHEQEDCDFRCVVCDHCHVLLSLQTMSNHLDNECQSRPRRCRLGCAQKISWANTLEHELNDCSKRLIHCKACDAQIWFCEREAHEKDECPRRAYGECDAGCGQCLRHDEVAEHRLSSCIKRLVACQGCKQTMSCSSLHEHQALLCPRRVIRCRKGCGMALLEVDVDKHEEEECSKRLLLCGNECGLHVSCCEMEAHRASKCLMRVIECPTGCRDRMFAYLVEDHWKRCRQRVVPCGVGGKLCARPIRMWHLAGTLVRCAVHGESALLWAVKSHDIELVTYLLQNVESSDAVNEEFTNGCSPLVLASSLGHVDLVELLLDFGADVNLETSRGRTPLSEACMAQDLAIVKLLIERRASVLHINRQGRTLVDMVDVLASSSAESLQWHEIRALLEEQATLERDQRELFVAIACSDYDYVAQSLKYSGKVAAETLFANPVEALQELIDDKKKQAATTHTELDEAMRSVDESIVDTEAKCEKVRHLDSQIEDTCHSLEHVVKAEEMAEIHSNALEADMLAVVHQITAQDIAHLLNSHIPSDEALVVAKALVLLCGIRSRGQQKAIECTDIEWWKRAQALLMDQSLLRRLRSYRQETIAPDVMTKVRRECLETRAFAACTASLKESHDCVDLTNGRRLPAVDSLCGNIVGILATWVQGVDIEYTLQTERQALVERKQQLESSLVMTRELQLQANNEAQGIARALRARQEEMEAVRHRHEAAKREVEVARKRLKTYKLLNYVALSGHTPLTFACAIGNDAIVHMLHGATSGHLFEEQVLCASLIQVVVREFLSRKKLERQQQSRGTIPSFRSDAAIAALARNVTHSFIVTTYQRKLVHFRQTHRVALHEAVMNGYPDIAALLLSRGAKLWQKTFVRPERVYPGALLENLAPVSQKGPARIKVQREWKLQPLMKERPILERNSDNAVQVRRPMTLMDTLNCALLHYDSSLSRSSKGWQSSGTTLYAATAQFVNKAMAMREAARQEWQRARTTKQIVKRANAELQTKHLALETAIISRDFVAVSRLLDDGAFADYEARNDALSALMAACVEEMYVTNEDNEDVLAVRYLLDRTMNCPCVDFESSRGATALGTAAFYGTLQCAQTLIERGANLNLASHLTGQTALMVAAGNGNEAFVRFLLTHHDVDVYLRDINGMTALDHAQSRGFVDITGLLAAAMGGHRGRVASSVSGLYGVCKWGCGFMAPCEGHQVHEARVMKATKPLEEHEVLHCPKRHVTCPKNCGVNELWAQEVNDHMEHTCVLRLVHCTNQSCSVQVAFQDLVRHLQDECEHRTVLCACSESMIHQQLQSHLQTQCPLRLVPCPLECTMATNGDDRETDTSVFQLSWQDVKAHVSSACPHRYVRCRNGCAMNDLLLKDRSHHETTSCLHRRVACRWGCNEPVFARTQASHEQDECHLRQQTCPNNCSENNVLVLLMDDHVSISCSRRLVLCSLDCGRRVPLDTMEKHIANDCCKRIVTCGNCQELITEEGRRMHERLQCPNRLTLCGLCGQSCLSRAQLAQHCKEECNMRQVSCKYECFVKFLLAHDKERHEKSECVLRPIWCPLGCGKVVAANRATRHEESECSMRLVMCGNGCGEEIYDKDRVQHEHFGCRKLR